MVFIFSVCFMFSSFAYVYIPANSFLVVCEEFVYLSAPSIRYCICNVSVMIVVELILVICSIYIIFLICFSTKGVFKGFIHRQVPLVALEFFSFLLYTYFASECERENHHSLSAVISLNDSYCESISQCYLISTCLTIFIFTKKSLPIRNLAF